MPIYKIELNVEIAQTYTAYVTAADSTAAEAWAANVADESQVGRIIEDTTLTASVGDVDEVDSIPEGYQKNIA